VAGSDINIPDPESNPDRKLTSGRIRTRNFGFGFATLCSVTRMGMVHSIYSNTVQIRTGVPSFYVDQFLTSRQNGIYFVVTCVGV